MNPEIRTAPHPHHPKITELGCVKGKVSVSWFTYPFNPEQVKNNRKPNFLFNRGFTLKTDVALECGDVKVAAGRYAFAFQLDAKAENWSALLIPQKMAQLQRQLGRARRRGGDVEGLEKQLADLTKKGIEELSLPSTTGVPSPMSGGVLFASA